MTTLISATDQSSAELLDIVQHKQDFKIFVNLGDHSKWPNGVSF